MSAAEVGNTPAVGVLHTLAVLSILELVTICALLANLFTAHARVVSQLLGPCHGALYLCVSAVALLARGLRPRTRVSAVLPVVGGVLTLINVKAERLRVAPKPAAPTSRPLQQ